MRVSFKVKQSKGAESHDFMASMPTSIEDTDLIGRRFGTVERMIDRANSQWRVDVAPGMRKRLPDVEAAQEYADGFCADGRKSAPVAIRISQEEQEAQGFTPEQLALLEQKGIKI